MLRRGCSALPRHSFRQAFVAGVSNDYIGYLVTAADHARPSYVTCGSVYEPRTGDDLTFWQYYPAIIRALPIAPSAQSPMRHTTYLVGNEAQAADMQEHNGHADEEHAAGAGRMFGWNGALRHERAG